MQLNWHWYTLNDFDPATLLGYLKLRQDVFVVEQKCTAPDIDDYDLQALHLIGYGTDGTPLACLRLIPPGLKFAEPALGRVVVHADARRGGTGSALLREGLAQAELRWPGQDNRISAQSHLQAFYGAVGYETVSQEYEEDGIPHVEMLRKARLC